MNGFEFEDFLSKLFKNMGYKVTQTKLSGDQGADLIIERNHKKTVVQAKCYSGKLSNKAIQEVVASIKHYKASAGMVVTNSHFTPSAVKLADSNEVRLIDRNKLKELIEKYMN
ncbi:MAG: restriction endonuclease [Candidatus Aenigmarchaeota archaeon]|nr:restriction endonuclease [Candidatus Aenigmarchaeota archaeon]